jgi:iron complex outermembrane recepter protein
LVPSLNPLVASDQQVTLGSRLPNTPEWSVNSYAAHTLELGTSGELRSRVDWSYSSQVENDAVNSIFLRQPGYHLVNASIGYHDTEKGWSLTGYVKNLTDLRYIISGDSNFGIGFHEANFNAPREWGVTVRYQY